MTEEKLKTEWDPEIQHIVCAVRGIPESRKTVDAAIEIASKQDARLTFLLILEFLTFDNPGRENVVTSLAANIYTENFIFNCFVEKFN